MAKKTTNRRFSKIFELWQTAFVFDGFSGKKSGEDVLLTKSWAEIKTANATSRFRNTDNGITSNTNQIVITTRKRKDVAYNSINQYIVYRGEKYTISNQPYEIDFDNSLIEILATKNAVKSVIEIVPVGKNIFDHTFDHTFN